MGLILILAWMFNTSELDEFFQILNSIKGFKLRQTQWSNTTLIQQFKSDIQENKDNISHIALENTSLKKENAALKKRLNQIEQNQLKNNVIITGIPEQPWETYNTTKQRVIDTIASALKSNSDEERQANSAVAQNTKITYCTRIGRYRTGFCRPISVTFQRQEDKEILMSGK